MNEIGKRIHIFSLFMIVLLVSCAAIPMSANSQDSGETVLSVGFVGEVESGNPFMGYSDTSEFYYSMIYECLISLDEDLEIIPNLASSWWYMDGLTAESLGHNFSAFDENQNPADWPLGSIWEYNITPDVFWNDGEPFTAEDIEWTINQQILDCYMTYWKYQAYTRWIYHAEAVNDHKVRIFFSDPFEIEAPMPVAWGNSIFMPIFPKHQFEDQPIAYLGFSWDGVPPIGTGPFMATDNLQDELIAQERITLLMNPYYNFWEDGTHKGLGGAYGRSTQIDKLLIELFAEDATLELAIKVGNVDVGEIRPQTHWVWETDEEFPDWINTVALLDSRGLSKTIGINSNPDSSSDPLDPPLSPLRLDPAVKRAAVLATDKDRIIDQCFYGLAEEGVGLISDAWDDWFWEPGTDDSTYHVYNSTKSVLFEYTRPLCDVIDYDIALANQILNAAGYAWSGEVGNSPRYATMTAAERLNNTYDIPIDDLIDLELSLEFYVREDIEEDRRIAEFLQKEWMKIGIALNLNLVVLSHWSNMIYTYGFDVQLTTWSGYPDPSYLLFVPTSYALYGWNEFGTASDEYDSLFLNQTTSMDYNDRKHWINKCLEWQYLSGSIITTVYPKTCYAYNDESWTNWGNWPLHPGLAIGRNFCTVNPLIFNLEFHVQSPIALFTIDPEFGDLDTVFTVNASESYDYQEATESLEVRWDWEDDGVWDTNWSINKTEQYQYLEEGDYAIRLEVRDSDSLTNETVLQLTVENESFIAQYWWAIGIAAAVIVALIMFMILSRKKFSPKEPPPPD